MPLTVPGPLLFPGPLTFPLESLMAIVSTINPGLDGAAVTVANASSGGDKVAPGTRVHVINGGGAPVTLTVPTPGSVRGRAIADTQITIPNGAFPANMRVFDVPGDLYADPSDGLVNLQWSAVTNVTLWTEGPVLS
jgi:hypothetical protein